MKAKTYLKPAVIGPDGNEIERGDVFSANRVSLVVDQHGFTTVHEDEDAEMWIWVDGDRHEVHSDEGGYYYEVDR